MPTPNENLIRADLAIADLSANGGVLSPEQTNQFIDFIYEEPTIIKQARLIRMAAPEVKVNRMGFGSRILRAARTTGSALDDGGNDRYVRAADRAKPTTSQIELTSKEVIAEVRLPYEVLEDNIEGQNFEAHVLKHIAMQIAVDLEELGLWGDTTSGDSYLALVDGWLKRVNVNVLNNASAGITPDLFANALLALPQKYLRNLPQMRAFVSEANRIKYQQYLSRRSTALGDTALTNGAQLVAHGLRIEAAPMLAVGASGEKGIVTPPQNLIVGVRREISIESDKDIRSREYIIVVTMRVGFQVDDTAAAVRIDNIGGLAPVPAVPVLVTNDADSPVVTDELP